MLPAGSSGTLETLKIIEIVASDFLKVDYGDFVSNEPHSDHQPTHYCKPTAVSFQSEHFSGTIELTVKRRLFVIAWSRRGLFNLAAPNGWCQRPLLQQPRATFPARRHACVTGSL